MGALCCNSGWDGTDGREHTPQTVMTTGAPAVLKRLLHLFILVVGVDILKRDGGEFRGELGSHPKM